MENLRNAVADDELQEEAHKKIQALSKEEYKLFARKQNVLVHFLNCLVDETGIISSLQAKFIESWIPYFAFTGMNDSRNSKIFIHEFMKKMEKDFHCLSSYQFPFIIYFLAECYKEDKNG